MGIDEQILAYLTPAQKEQLAIELEINERLPKCLRGEPTDDHWKPVMEIKLQAIRDAKYIADRKQRNKEAESLANQRRIIDYWERGMTERQKLQRALSNMLEQFIDEVKNQPLTRVNFKNASSVHERKNQLTVIRQTMDTIRGLKELLATMEAEDGEQEKQPISAENLILIDSAKALLHKKKIKSEL